MPVAVTHHSRYNQLPSIQTANTLLNDLTTLGKVFATLAGNKDFAVTLVHRHCELKDGELMVNRGNTTQPEKIDPSLVFPMSWLATGEAFEYSADRNTPALPKELLTAFGDAVADAGVVEYEGIPILGLCSAPAPLPAGQLYFEITEGRKNIVSIREATNNPEGVGYTTTWINGEPRCVCSNKFHGQSCEGKPCKWYGGEGADGTD